jgi:threonine aldolase
MTADAASQLLEPDTFYDVEVVDLLAVENTVGAAMGSVMPAEEMRAVRKVAQEAGVPIHMDGARMFNAAAAAGCDVTDWTREVDTVMFCVSKGLGAPIGSLLCGTAEQVREARRLCVLFGGAWRQAGIMAAAGLIALEDGPPRLHQDHARAQRIAQAMAELIPSSVDPGLVETNMVFIDTSGAGLTAVQAIQGLNSHGVGATMIGPATVRMVTHVGIDDEGVDLALEAWNNVVAAGVAGP